jgi:leader peptidase (prepilin peptidase)/N-methyltransferase
MVIGILIIGWIAGVLINYITDVMPSKRRLVNPFCSNCEKPQPLINYIFWPRKCPHCKNTRSRRTWLVELLAILITLWLWRQPNLVFGFWLSMALVIYFGVVVIIDLEHHLIMHPVSIVGVVLGLLVGIPKNGILDTALGGLAGFGAMLLLYLFGALFARYVVRRSQANFDDEALGFGDVILGGVLGLMLGWPVILVGLFLAILLAGAISLIYLIAAVLTRKYRSFTFIPYGPFMIAGASALIFFGQYFAGRFGG